MNPLKNIIAGMIHENGPMDVGTYMGLCLGHPQYGYYMTRDPFGAAGDFVTAPEISQMFGEMIGAWLADLWLRMGAPKLFALLEAGPGRGTLTKDILRATRSVTGFHAALRLHLLETGPVLRGMQQQVLAAAGFAAQWHDTLDACIAASEGPLFCVANEFLDALPVRQFQMTPEGWRERLIQIDGEGRFYFGLGPILAIDLEPAAPGTIHESALARVAWLGQLGAALKLRGGAALIVDYGVGTLSGNTLQAVRGHRRADPLDDPGQADITSHVDFAALKAAAIMTCGSVQGPVGQGSFLKNLGIEARAERLGGSDAVAALHRLTAAEGMGALFKVMAMTAPGMPVPAGFYPA